ncbi:unnamed protein product [Bursaphelenchus xylophilus]|uniref:(pine wood nematode) hypothetical protein n=1 Tax=Bursaphelenchus xylophilus TaxID=6326 RepID=A0A1I7S028_BURXY|nr:unnamed protein product [Bursaphelenchus xylophilus]CAG9109060.1 unnamed protein product [Bursaphelenchus xylophilus]
MPDDDDTQSVQSASVQDQIVFWTLSISFFFKLVAFVCTVVDTHYHQWIQLTSGNDTYEFVRGIAHSDCAINTQQSRDIQCQRWTYRDNIDKGWIEYWSRFNLNHEDVTLPGGFLWAAYYVAIMLFAVYAADLVISLMMCCRQKQTENGIFYLKVFSWVLAGFIVMFYMIIVIAVCTETYAYIQSSRYFFEAHFGLGMKSWCILLFLYISAVIIQNAYHLYNCRHEYTSLVPWSVPKREYTPERSTHRNLELDDLRAPTFIA